jgi:hypothetical protein
VKVVNRLLELDWNEFLFLLLLLRVVVVEEEEEEKSIAKY